MQEATPRIETTIAAGASLLLSSKILGRGLAVGSQVVLARWLGPDVFGIYVIGWTVLLLSSVIAPMGLDKGVLRFGSQYSEQTDRVAAVVRQSLVVSLLVGLGLAVILLAGSAPIANLLFRKPDVKSVLMILALALPLVAALRVAGAATRLTKRMHYTVLSEDLGQPGLLFTVLLVAAVAGAGLIEAVWLTVVSFAAAFALSMVFVARLFPGVFQRQRQPERFYRDLISFSIPASMAGVAAMMTIWSDRIMVGIFLPAADVGVYQAASQISLVFTIILGAFSGVFAPVIGELHAAGDRKRLREVYAVATKWGLYVSVPIFLAIAFAGRSILVGVFGAPFAGGEVPLVILCVGQLVNVGTGAVGLLLIMTGRQKLWLRISMAALMGNILLNLSLIPILGMTGAALATSVSVGLMFVIALIQAKRELSVWPYDRRFLKGLYGASVATLALVILSLLPTEYALLEAALFVVTALTVFFATLLVVGLDEEDGDVIKTLMSGLRTFRRSRVA